MFWCWLSLHSWDKSSLIHGVFFKMCCLFCWLINTEKSIVYAQKINRLTHSFSQCLHLVLTFCYIFFHLSFWTYSLFFSLLCIMEHDWMVSINGLLCPLASDIVVNDLLLAGDSRAGYEWSLGIYSPSVLSIRLQFDASFYQRFQLHSGFCK